MKKKINKINKIKLKFFTIATLLSALFCCLFSLSALTHCGQSGPLYLPKNNTQQTNQTNQTNQTKLTTPHGA